MRTTVTFFVILVLLLCFSFGCGSSTYITKSIDLELFSSDIELNYEIAEIKPGQTKAPDHFLIALDSYLRAELQGGNLTGKETGKNYLVNITIKKYRMRRGFVKRMFGILAGKDGVKSLVTVIDPESDKVIGESFISTTNLTKSVTMDDVAHMHAGEIARFLAGETR